MATYYRWDKYNVTYSEEITSDEGGSYNYGVQTVDSIQVEYRYQSNAYQIKDGHFYIDDPGVHTLYPGDSYVGIGGDDEDNVCLYIPTLNEDVLFVGYLSVDFKDNKNVVVSGRYPASDFEIHKIKTRKGSRVGYVYSTSSSAYPNGGVQDGYYYDQRTTVTSPTAPTGLTYPNPITTPSAAISWTSATSATDYPVSLYEVSYSTNGGSSWTVAGTTAEVSYTFSITPGTTSIMFRVRAQDSNGQWGVYMTGTASQVLLAPTLTVPQMVMQGQSVPVNWTAISGASSYTLQRKANTDADWVQVYSGGNTTFSETAGTWTSVQYRVQAVFSGTAGGWATSASIPVISASALVISGSDGDLGTVVNDIPYTISSDTGNQITATISVNSAVIFSGNVGTGAADSIPVLDLVNGEGTIVIEASVQASSGTVTAARTWTYTKAPITFPNAGSVAQLTQQGANIWPKTLAECVRLPGGKTLDEVTAFPCQVYTGSYVGTGTSGQNNPTTLTFPFEPKIVFIARETTRSAGDSLGTITPMIRGVQRSIVGINGSSINIAYLTWDNNSLSFYGNGGADTSLNESGITYHYVAIG